MHYMHTIISMLDSKFLFNDISGNEIQIIILNYESYPYFSNIIKRINIMM